MAKKVMKKYQGKTGSSTTKPTMPTVPMMKPTKVAVPGSMKVFTEAERAAAAKKLFGNVKPKSKKGGTTKGKTR